MRRKENGMVTAETMVVLPVLILVTLLLAGGLQVVVARSHLSEAARHGARLVARGETDARTINEVQRTASGAEVEIVRKNGLVTVVVSRRISVPAAPKLSTSVSSTATAMLE